MKMMTNITYIVRANDYHVFEIDMSGTKIRSCISKEPYKVFALSADSDIVLNDLLKNGHFIIDKKYIKHYKKLNFIYEKIIEKMNETDEHGNPKGIDNLSDGEREFMGF